jgi:hypothetical protein
MSDCECPYKKHVEFRFEVGGYDLTTDNGCTSSIVVNKPGDQEAFVSGMLVNSGGWRWEKGASFFDTFVAEGLSDEILEFVREHGSPWQGWKF